MLFSLWKEQLKKPKKTTNPTLNRIANLWGVWRRNNRGYSETVPLVKINILKCYLLTDSKWKCSFIFLFWILNLRTLLWATTSTQVVTGFSHYISLSSCKLPLTLHSVYVQLLEQKMGLASIYWFMSAALFSAAMPSVNITKQKMFLVHGRNCWNWKGKKLELENILKSWNCLLQEFQFNVYST